MGIERARFRLQRELSGLEDMERDGHPDVAQAGRTLAALLRDDIAALDAEREKVARLERERDELAARLESPELLKALSTVALHECERAIRQAREYDRTGISTAAHADHGAQYDTCFDHVFRLTLLARAAGLRGGR